MSSPAGPSMSPRQAIEQLGVLPLADHSVHSVLQIVADLSRQVLPDAAEVSVSLLTEGRPSTVVYTGQLALDLDEAQYGRGRGAVPAGRHHR